MQLPFETEQLVELLPFSETRFWKFNRFSERVNALRSHYADLSARGIPYWPYFTLHDEGHIHRVLNNLFMILSNIYQGHQLRLNALEMFILISATYTHDIGMFLPIGEDDLLLPQVEGKSQLLIHKYQVVFENIRKGAYSHNSINQLYGAFIRDFHHLRSGNFIRSFNNAKALQIEDWQGLIAIVSEGHRKVDLYAQRYSPINIGTTTVRLDLLSALLRVADEFDVLRDRVPNALTLINSPSIDAETRKHWVRHFCTEGLSISTTKYGSIVFEIVHKTFEKDDNGIIQKRIRRIVSENIDAQLRYTNNIFIQYGLIFPSQVNLVTQNPKVSVISQNEIDRQTLFDIFFEREFEFHCPALQKYLGIKKLVTIEQRGKYLICEYDENEHKKGYHNYCTASAGILFDCGFCAAYPIATIEDKNSPILFSCPIYTVDANNPSDLVTLNWIETKKRKGKYKCNVYEKAPKEWCYNCGFGGKATREQVIKL